MVKAAVVKSGIAVGRKRGHITTSRQQAPRAIQKKGRLGSRKKLARTIIRDLVGFAPYERRILAHLDNGLEKRALKLAKSRLGTHKRAKAKREELQTVRRRRQQKAAAST